MGACFADVPAFRLKQLRDTAPAFYADEALAGARSGWRETMRRTFAQREFYACAGATDAAAVAAAVLDGADGDLEGLSAAHAP